MNELSKTRVRLKCDEVKEFAKREFGSQAKMAEVLGVNSGAFYGWTNGHSEFPLEVAMKIADLMDVPLGEIMESDIGIKRLDEFEKRLERVEKMVEDEAKKGWLGRIFK